MRADFISRTGCGFMTRLSESADSKLSSPFRYYEFTRAFDEMFECEGHPRSQYSALYKRLLELAPEELQRRQQAADQHFLHQGITFTVYGSDQGTERVFPYDL